MLDFQKYFKERIEYVRKLEHLGNNQLFEAGTRERRYLLKAYSEHIDNWKRGEKEFAAVSYLWSKKFLRGKIPEPIAFHKDENIAIYSYEDGKILKPSEIGTEAVDAAVSFLATIHGFDNKNKKLFGPASSACLSLLDYLLVLDKRFSKVSVFIPENSLLEKAKKFVNAEVYEKMREIRAKFVASANSINLGKELLLEEQVLTPADFGFHNILVDFGKYTFIDFEYFGRDDPARQILDFLHHDRSREIKRDVKELFVKKYFDRARPINGFEERLRLADPMIGMAWVLIYLNVLNQDYLKHVKFTNENIENIIEERIEKAKEKLNDLYYFK